MTIKLLGQLGNQMFIYAFAKALQEQGCNMIIDGSDYAINARGGA